MGVEGGRNWAVVLIVRNIDIADAHGTVARRVVASTKLQVEVLVPSAAIFLVSSTPISRL